MSLQGGPLAAGAMFFQNAIRKTRSRLPAGAQYSSARPEARRGGVVAPGIVPKVVIRAESANDRERLWLEDSGIGIAKRDRERLFRVFERLHRIEEYPGTGIGLAIVLRAMEVGFESQVDQGSKFWVKFMKDLP